MILGSNSFLLNIPLSYILSQNPKVGHFQSWPTKPFSLPQSTSNIETIQVLNFGNFEALKMGMANLTLLIYLLLKSVGGFQFSHSKHFPGLAKCANIDHGSAQPNYFNLIFLCENKRCLPNCWCLWWFFLKHGMKLSAKVNIKVTVNYRMQMAFRWKM